jgi:hypothetical protein
MAITGHRSLSEVSRYTKAADQAPLSEQAMSKMMKAEHKSCRFEPKALEEGVVYGPRSSMPLYLLLNAAVAVAGFGIIYGLTFLLPALARRYWRWLNT